MPGLNFPVYKTKIVKKQTFRLEDPAQRAKYFQLKAGKEIAKLRKYLQKNSFVGFLLGKKNSGKGTYSKLFMEALGGDSVAHVSVGDIVRHTHKSLENPKRKRELIGFLRQRYRGFMSIEQELDIIEGRDTGSLLPTEIILALVEHEISLLKGKAIFIDGFPRNLDQISYSLYFRALMGYRDDPDFFVFIDIPETILEARMKGRVICPICFTPRHPVLLRTRDIGYDERSHEFYLKCDTPSCKGVRMTAKEGDTLGIEAIRDRLEMDDAIMRQLLTLQGVPKVYLRNSVPVKEASKLVDAYELTPAYRYEWDAKKKQVKAIEEPWIVMDADGVPSYSLLPAAVVVSFIKQTAKVLG